MPILKILAVLFGLLAFSDLIKPLELSGEEGFVFLGRRLSGAPNLIAAPVFAVFLAAYAAALWRARAHALPMGLAYAGFVSANLFLFVLRGPAGGAEINAFGIAYVTLALAGAWGAVYAIVQSGIARGEPEGRTLLRTFALLFALMALSNVLKPFAYTDTVGFVLFGQRLAGTANAVAALVFAAFLAGYAAAIWLEKKVAVGMGVFYALYVLANLVLWNVRKPEGSDTPLVFALPYLASAIGVSSGAAWLLWKHRARLQ